MPRYLSWLLKAAFAMGVVLAGTYVDALVWGLPAHERLNWNYLDILTGTRAARVHAANGLQVEAVADWSGFALAFADGGHFLEGWENEHLLAEVCVVPAVPVSRVDNPGNLWRSLLFDRHPGDHVWRLAVSTPLILVLLVGPAVVWWRARYHARHGRPPCGDGRPGS